MLHKPCHESPQHVETLRAGEISFGGSYRIDFFFDRSEKASRSTVSGNASFWNKRLSSLFSTLVLSIVVFNSISLSEAFVTPQSRFMRRLISSREAPSSIPECPQNLLPTIHTISTMQNYILDRRSCTAVHSSRRKSATPVKVAPLKSKSKPRSKKKKSTQFEFGNTQSEALLSTIAVAAEMDDTVASVFSPPEPSNPYGIRARGRPSSVAGATSKSTMSYNIKADAAADEMIANGMVSHKSKADLMKIAQERKKEADRKRYYEEVAVDDEYNGLPNSFYENIQVIEKSYASLPSPSSSPPPMETSTLTSPQQEKKRRGRPRKNILPDDDFSPSVTSLEQTRNQSTRRKNNFLKYNKPNKKKTKQVRKKDTNGNTKADKLNLIQYYNTELLSVSEEYSLGMKVKFLMKCEDVYQGLNLHFGRNPSIAEWAAACGFNETDDMSRDGYVESRLESSIKPDASDIDLASKARDDEEEITGSRFVGNGLEEEQGVGRGRGRAKKKKPIALKDFYDDSYIKFNLSPQEDDPYTGFELTEKGKRVLVPINRGTPRHFVEMILTSKESKQRMVECNMRLVVSIARRYNNVGVSIQDLVQEGSLGLARAAEKFDPKKGFKFSTYASWWIQQAIFRSIAYHSRTIRLPVHVHNILNRARRSKTNLQQELGRVPTNEEMAAELAMTPEKYAKLLNLTKKTISLEKPKYTSNPKDMGQESDLSVGDTIDGSASIKDDNTPEQAVDQGLFQDDLKSMLTVLGEDERRVICARYGIYDGVTRTVSAVAVQLRQTKSWVRSQECRALRKLRRPWYEKVLKEHQDSLTSR